MEPVLYFKIYVRKKIFSHLRTVFIMKTVLWIDNLFGLIKFCYQIYQSETLSTSLSGKLVKCLWISSISFKWFMCSVHKHLHIIPNPTVTLCFSYYFQTFLVPQSKPVLSQCCFFQNYFISEGQWWNQCYIYQFMYAKKFLAILGQFLSWKRSCKLTTYLGK